MAGVIDQHGRYDVESNPFEKRGDTLPARPALTPGYWWYRKITHVAGEYHGYWCVCLVSGGYAHFFGEVSQRLGNDYLTNHVEFGREVEKTYTDPPVMSTYFLKAATAPTLTELRVTDLIIKHIQVHQNDWHPEAGQLPKADALPPEPAMTRNQIRGLVQEYIDHHMLVEHGPSIGRDNTTGSQTDITVVPYPDHRKVEEHPRLSGTVNQLIAQWDKMSDNLSRGYLVGVHEFRKAVEDARKMVGDLSKKDNKPC